MGVFFHKVWTVVGNCWNDRSSLSSFDEYNDACLRLLARFTVTGNSWQQECSRSLLLCLYRAQFHYWLAGFFIQQLPVNKSHSKAPPTSHLWSLGIAFWPPDVPEQLLWAHFKGSLLHFRKWFSGPVTCSLRWWSDKMWDYFKHHIEGKFHFGHSVLTLLLAHMLLLIGVLFLMLKIGF